MKNTMKKLMIALAAVAMVGSVSADCGDAKPGCLVYDLKVTLKTLGPKVQKCKSTCADDKVYYLDTVTRVLKGYAWSCDYNCMCDATGNTELSMALWEPKAKLGWWLYDSNGNDTEKLDIREQTIRFGKKGKKASVWFNVSKQGTDYSTVCSNSLYTVNSTLDFVGLGSVVFDKRLNDCIVKTVSGNVIGNVTPDVRCEKTKETSGSWCSDKTTECCLDYNIVWACLCNCDPDWCAIVDHVKIMDATDLPQGVNGSNCVPAYGTWSMKYNASLSKGKVTLQKKLPKYATK